MAAALEHSISRLKTSFKINNSRFSKYLFSKILPWFYNAIFIENFRSFLSRNTTCLKMERISLTLIQKKASYQFQPTNSTGTHSSETVFVECQFWLTLPKKSLFKFFKADWYAPPFLKRVWCPEVSSQIVRIN